MSHAGHDAESKWVCLHIVPKLRIAIAAIGFRAVRMTLELYLLMEDPDVPSGVKATVVGALVYFIAPIDLIPDLAPLVGYSDDLIVLAAAVTAVSTHLTTEIRAKADTVARRFFH